jgi:GTP cyclohydrolase I
MIDVQSSLDDRNIPIAQVGIRDVKLPISFSDEGKTPCASVGNFSTSVFLPREKKGTHMSRFLPILYESANKLSLLQLETLSQEIKEKLESEKAFLKLDFPFFIEKRSPISGVFGLMDINVSIELTNTTNGVQKKVSLSVPIKSLCPCSKAISEAGAHSQRGIISIEVWDCHLSFAQLISFAEGAASSPLYPILKREDEKYVTEKAYSTPRFVEDLVRETAFALKKAAPHVTFEITAENFESIHNHNAWARVSSGDML